MSSNMTTTPRVPQHERENRRRRSSMPFERIVLSAKGRDQLITLKRRTGIDHWNVLCRWALCISLREPTPVPDSKISSDSNIEMSWRTFGGDYGDLYWCLLKQRCMDEGLDVHDD